MGYNKATFSNGTSEGGLGASSSFTYTYDPKTSIRFGFNDDYGYAATSFAYRNYGPFVAVTNQLTNQWSVNAQLAYNVYTYLTNGQLDHFYSGQAGVSYTVNVHLTVNANYTLAKDDSNITGQSFNNNIFSVSALLRF